MPVRNLKDLRKLRSAPYTSTNAELEAIASLPLLEELDLSGCLTTGDGLAKLQCLSNLKILDVSGTRVKDEHLNHLAPLKNLPRHWTRSAAG